MNKLSNPVKEHMRTLAFSNLLYNYGGLIIPNSMVVLRDLKPLYDDMVSRYNVFTFECVDRNSTSVATDFFPNARFLGAKRRSQVMKEYMEFATNLDPLADDVYRYLNFDEIESFQKSALKAKSKIEEIPVSVVN